MNTGFMGKGIGPDDGLVLLHWESCDTGPQTATGDYLRGVQIGITGKDILACAHGHHDPLQGCIPGPLSQAIDGALELTRPVDDGRQGVGNGKTEIVMTMDGEYRLVRVGHALDQITDQ